MRVKLQLVLCTDDGCEETVTDVITLQKDHQCIEHLGLTLAEAKQLLTTIPQRVLTQQVETFLASHHACDVCGAVLKVKGAHTRTLRTLFGTFTLPSPRFYRCRCRRHTTTTFRPLTALLPTSVAPEHEIGLEFAPHCHGFRGLSHSCFSPMVQTRSGISSSI